jgi:hypothetical protein
MDESEGVSLMASWLKTLTFPLVLLICITGAVMAWAALVVVSFLGIPWAVYRVMAQLYNGHKSRT